MSFLNKSSCPSENGLNQFTLSEDAQLPHFFHTAIENPSLLI